MILRKRNRIARIFTTILLAVVGLGIYPPAPSRSSDLAQTAGEDWPTMMHDAARSGSTSTALVPDGWSGPLHLQWKIGFGERVEEDAQPVVANGTLYIGVMNGKFYAIDTRSGQIKWVYQAGGEITNAAAVANGRVHFGSVDGKVYTLAADTGVLLWTYQTEGPLMSSPAVVDGHVFLGSRDGRMYALDGATGERIWAYQTDGPVMGSPAVGDGRVYFGSEDMHAYCVDAATGNLVWRRALPGLSMKATYPALDPVNDVVIFVTTKPGRENYMPVEDLPDFTGREPLPVWREYYQTYPQRQHLFFLDANSGEEKWFIPLPVPYWGTIVPVIDEDGYAWFPASGGGGVEGDPGFDHLLNHDMRLWKVNLANGAVTRAANQDDFMIRIDETGRPTIAGGKIYWAIDADVSGYDPSNDVKWEVFGNDIFSHVAPLDPPPTDHPLRYGGSAWAGGITSASPLVVVDGIGYYTAFGWLYAISTEQVANPNVVDMGQDFVTGPVDQPMTPGSAVEELRSRVEMIIAHGHLSPQTKLHAWYGGGLHAFWFEGETIYALAQTMPYLDPVLQEQLRQYLRTEAEQYLFDSNEYVYATRCIEYDVNPESPCRYYPGIIEARWYANNGNLVGERLYAMWAYAHYTGDWDLVEQNWDLVQSLHGRFVDAFNADLGFAVFNKSIVDGRLSLHSQIGAMLAVSRMADHLGDVATRDQASDMADQMFAARLRLERYVPSLYDLPEGDPDKRYRQDLAINPDGSKNYFDWYQVRHLGIIPPQGYMDQENDPWRVIWMDESGAEIAPTFRRQYVDILGYRPLYPEVAQFLQENLRAEAAQYVETMTFNNPWWYWSDAAREITVRDVEERFSSPHLSFSIFQVKARVLGEDFDILKDQLPWTYANTGYRDIYRLQNLVALLETTTTTIAGKRAGQTTADYGESIHYTISVLGTGQPITVTDHLPDGVVYVDGSMDVEPNLGTLTAGSGETVQWTGTPPSDILLEIGFETMVITETAAIIENIAQVDDGQRVTEWSASVLVNGQSVFIPLVSNGPLTDN